MMSSGIAGATEAQQASGDGSLRYLLLAIGFLVLAMLLSGLWWIYFRATVPPARRPYRPPSISLPGEQADTQ
ncbi:MAG: hypothetical protein ACI8Y4_005327 [Candidatus Poriferisodalaceae bacterium]|jgi:hypothetical protein